MTKRAHLKMAKEFFQAIEKGNWAALRKLLADDYLFWAGGMGEIQNQLEDMIGKFASAMPDGVKFTVEAVTSEDSRLAVEATSYGKLRNGKIYNNHYHFLFEFRGDKIAVVREYGDTQHVNEVLGPVFAS